MQKYYCRSYRHLKDDKRICQTIYVNELDRLDAIHKWLERHNMPEHTQGEINNLKKSITFPTEFEL